MNAWSPEDLHLFIILYRVMPILYDTSLESYYNMKERNVCVRRLCNSLPKKTLEEIETVLKHINYFFRMEKLIENVDRTYYQKTIYQKLNFLDRYIEVDQYETTDFSITNCDYTITRFRITELKALLNLYRVKKCLYESNHPDALDGRAHARNFQQILRGVQAIRPKTTLYEIRHNLKIMLALYVSEHVRENLKLLNLLSWDENKIPTPWWYNLMVFLPVGRLPEPPNEICRHFEIFKKMNQENRRKMSEASSFFVEFQAIKKVDIVRESVLKSSLEKLKAAYARRNLEKIIRTEPVQKRKYQKRKPAAVKHVEIVKKLEKAETVSINAEKIENRECVEKPNKKMTDHEDPVEVTKDNEKSKLGRNKKRRKQQLVIKEEPVELPEKDTSYQIKTRRKCRNLNRKESVGSNNLPPITINIPLTLNINNSRDSKANKKDPACPKSLVAEIAGFLPSDRCTKCAGHIISPTQPKESYVEDDASERDKLEKDLQKLEDILKNCDNSEHDTSIDSSQLTPAIARSSSSEKFLTSEETIPSNEEKTPFENIMNKSCNDSLIETEEQIFKHLLRSSSVETLAGSEKKFDIYEELMSALE